MRCIRFAILSGLLASLVACGGGDDGNLTGTYSVRDVNVLAKDINVGESVRAEVFFDTKTEFDGTPDGTRVVVRLDSALRYQAFSSAIYDSDTDNSDPRSPDRIVPCANGSTFLVYEFSDSDLFNRAIGPTSRFGFKMQLIGASRSSNASVQAAAGSDQEYSCPVPFAFEQDEQIVVR